MPTPESFRGSAASLPFSAVSPTDLPALNIADLQALLRKGEVSPREVLDVLRARIEELEPKIDAYLSIDFEAAAKEAEKADVNLPLGGVPIAIKDIISVAGQPCTCASKILRNYRAPYDATVIRKLRAAGAIPFGKTNMDEFAMGSSTENSSVKLTHNPWDLSRACRGGSSGGSAAAVAVRMPGFLRRSRHRYRRINSAACRALRRRRRQAELWPRLALWRCRVRVCAGSSRAPDEKRATSALIMNAIAGHDPQDSMTSSAE